MQIRKGTVTGIVHADLSLGDWTTHWVQKKGLQPLNRAACFSFYALTVKKHSDSHCAWCKLTSAVACCYVEMGLTAKPPQHCIFVNLDM